MLIINKRGQNTNVDKKDNYSNLPIHFLQFKQIQDISISDTFT